MLDISLPFWEAQQRYHPLYALQETEAGEAVWQACGGSGSQTQRGQARGLTERGLRWGPNGDRPTLGPPLLAWASGDRCKGQSLQQEGPATKLLLCGPSSKISPSHREPSHHGNRKVAQPKRNQVPLSQSPTLSPGRACYGQAPGRHFHTQALPLRPAMAVLAPQVRALGLRQRLWPEAHTAQVHLVEQRAGIRRPGSEPPSPSLSPGLLEPHSLFPLPT